MVPMDVTPIQVGEHLSCVRLCENDDDGGQVRRTYLRT